MAKPKRTTKRKKKKIAALKEYAVKFFDFPDDPNVGVETEMKFPKLPAARQFARSKFREGNFIGLSNIKGVALPI